MTGSLERELEIATAAVAEAARFTESVRGAKAHEKNDRSPVTLADYGAQALILRRIVDAFPGDGVIAEEDPEELAESALLPTLVEALADFGAPRAADIEAWIGRGQRGAQGGGQRVWTLDPVDGTKGYLRGGHYAVALALLVEGRPVLGVLGCPGLGGVYTAVVGGAATKVGTGPVAVSTRDALADYRMCESVEAAHSAHGVQAAIAQRLGLGGESVRMDSQAKYAAVAEGQAELYLRLPTKPGYVEKIWDHAAGHALLEVAGGRVTDAQGQPLDFSLGPKLTNNRGIIATNGRHHDEVVAAVRVELEKAAAESR